MFEKSKSKANYVKRGYGQVEPNHLSAQRTAQIYAQLPAHKDIDVLENGQFVKYNYASGVCDFEGPGEWMLVYNEVKLYRDDLGYCDFAMINGNYAAKVYSPVDGDFRMQEGNPGEEGFVKRNPYVAAARDYSKTTAPADPYDPNSTDRPFQTLTFHEPKMMPEGTSMVPRVFKTNVGDIFTTNCISGVAKVGELITLSDIVVGAKLTPNEEGILTVTEETAGMIWQIVKVYTLPDRQMAVKVMRIS